MNSATQNTVNASSKAMPRMVEASPEGQGQVNLVVAPGAVTVWACAGSSNRVWLTPRSLPLGVVGDHTSGVTEVGREQQVEPVLVGRVVDVLAPPLVREREDGGEDLGTDLGLSRLDISAGR